jgi:ABC-type Fe3+/spermidine/putrescine transport system ATPase subunit
MLSVKNIEKDYEGKPLLCGVSFEVDQDETVCLLGSSGSGKSTLLRIIAGLETAKGGQVLWNRKSLTDTPPHKREFGLMFQDYALFPHRNVAENIAFGLRMQHLPKDEIKERVQQALKTINMRDFSDRKVTELSGGEQQRVALARALAPEPRLLMLDEPLGALDRTLREQLSRELRRILRESKVPAIYVTHDQEEAFSIADRILLLHHGIILQSGKPHEIYHHPKNVWVAKFFGLGNLIEGQVVSTSPLKVDSALGILTASCEGDPPTKRKTTTLLLRPTAACASGADCGNTIRGKVMDRVFQGETYRVTLHCNQTVPFFNVNLQEAVEIGSSIEVGYRAEDILCLQKENDES